MMNYEYAYGSLRLIRANGIGMVPSCPLVNKMMRVRRPTYPEQHEHFIKHNKLCWGN